MTGTTHPWARRVIGWAACGCAVLWLALPSPARAAEGGETADGQRTSRISDDAVPLINPEDFPQRPKPLLELGNPFLGTGDIDPGIELPGGAVWQPSLLVFGTYRTAIQTFEGAGGKPVSEWANRLDLFANLQLSGTERFLFGVRPLDEDGRFTGYRFGPKEANGWEDEFNFDITTAFFEGDFGELFPDLDPQDSAALDWGFAVGRQPLFFQEGMLINDNLDALGVIRNTLLPPGGTDLQATFIWAWNDVDRRVRGRRGFDSDGDLRNLPNINDEDKDAQLFGLFLQADYPTSTFNGDLVYLWNDDETDGLFWGLSAVQRIGHFNTSFRVLGSHALGEETATMRDGYLFFGEVSFTPAWTHDHVYVNAFWGIDEFTSAARDPSVGGPLGRAGILFAAVGLGRYGAPLGNDPDNSFGGAIGYQMFLDADHREQIVFELGGRLGTDDNNSDAIALGARWQKALWQHVILQVDVFGNYREIGHAGGGARFEIRVEF